jgi:hypothetical protein
MLFTEDFLHYVWKFRLFDRLDLQTEDGEVLEIFSTGVHNTDSGPDFHNARIKIGETLWAGNVEVHLSASDWQKHGHTTDDAYNNVILHVVYNNDLPLKLNNGRTCLPCSYKTGFLPNCMAVITRWYLATKLLYHAKPA